MGALIAKLLHEISSFSSSKLTKILMLGLDGAGKTTIIHKLKLNEYISTAPTIGFNVKNVDYKDLRMIIWDIGGPKRSRYLWKPYYAHTDALIFIVDSYDEERLDMAKEGPQAVIGNEELRDVPVLIFANKQDIGRVSVAEMMSRLEVGKWKREWRIEGTCAVNGDGLYEGLDWLSKVLKKSKKSGISMENIPESIL